AAAPPPPGGPAAGPTAQPASGGRRVLLVALAAVVVVAVAVGVTWAVSSANSDSPSAAGATATAEPAVEEPQLDDPLAELTGHLSEPLLATCPDGALPNDTPPVLATAACSDWSFELYPSAADAATTVRDNNGGTIEPGTPCDVRPDTDTYHLQRFDRGVLGCRDSGGEYVVEWAIDGVPVLAVRYATDDVEDYGVIYEEAVGLAAEVG
ncbi:hypothetical protein, partial [Pseudonocardia abyssalis]|nr:hypothetical protein [Pseudonocardia abyssalis]